MYLIFLRPNFLIGAFLFFSSNLFATEIDQEWLNLLHYKKNLFSGYTSQSDGTKFFQSTDGKDNPRNELNANIEAMNLEQGLEEHAKCKFPARYRYLRSKNLIKNNDAIKCPELDKFFKLLNPSGVSLVFSSYYLDTPASTFGHTFLKIIRRDLGDQSNTDLLNYAINYAATVTTQNALFYALLGLAGGFVGEFSSLPYFYKVREYNDHESRDLWEYQLNLSDLEIFKIVEHIWEMRQNYFTYYYLTENCSYHMLGLLDAINPDWKLTERNPHFVLPADTVKTIMTTPGLVKDIKFSPSKRRTTMAQIEKLNSNELLILKKTLRELKINDEIKKLTPESQVKILDGLIEGMDFLYADDILLKNGPKSEVKHQFLIYRSQINHDSELLEIPVPKSEAPHLGHGSRRIKLGFEAFDKNRGETFEFRFALHDLLDPLPGQARFATMEMGKFTLKYKNEKKKIRPEEITWINVASLNPWNNFTTPLSWKAWLGSKSLKDKSCSDCLTHGAKLAAGMSYDYKDFLFYSMLGSEMLFGPKDLDKNNYRISLFPEIHLLWRVPYFSIDLFSIYERFIFHEVKDQFNFGAEASVPLSSTIGLSFKYQNSSHKDLYFSSLQYFF